MITVQILAWVVIAAHVIEVAVAVFVLTIGVK